MTDFSNMKRLEDEELRRGTSGIFKIERQEKKDPAFRFVNRGGFGRFSERLTSHQIRRLIERFGNSMEKLGYRIDDFAAGLQRSGTSSPMPASCRAAVRRLGAPSRAVIYVVSGRQHAREAETSIASVKKHLPGARCIVYTHDDVNVAGADEIRIEPPCHNPFLYKVHCLGKVEESRFLFLDTDTLVIDDVSELFDILDRFDLAAVHAPIRLSKYAESEQIIFDGRVPDCYSEFNTGVLAIRRSDEMTRVLGEWKEIFATHMSGSTYPWTHDQPAFRQAVYNSSLRVLVLPAEYNFRIPFPGMVGGPIRILHGRHSHLLEIGQRLNLMRGPRAACARQFARNMVVYSD